MDTNELNTNTDKKILLVSVSPFGFSEDNMQIYNLVSNIVISGSKCKLAILCLDINLPFSLKSYSINDIPYIDNFTEKNLFQNIRFYSTDKLTIWKRIYDLNLHLNFDKLIVYNDLTNFEIYSYPKIDLFKILVINQINKHVYLLNLERLNHKYE